MATITSSPEDVFYTIDPLMNTVYLTKERFYKHIITEHIEMTGHEGTIKQVVENPDYIYRDKKYNNTVCYISSHNNSTLSNLGDYVKVVVNRDLGGQIITAYPTGTNTDNGKEIYSRK